MGAVWFIDVDHSIFKGKDLHWTQSNAGPATKTTIFVHHEFMGRNPGHDLWKNSL
jgi:hypothetical protein